MKRTEQKIFKSDSKGGFQEKTMSKTEEQLSEKEKEKSLQGEEGTVCETWRLVFLTGSTGLYPRPYRPQVWERLGGGSREKQAENQQRQQGPDHKVSAGLAKEFQHCPKNYVKVLKDFSKRAISFRKTISVNFYKLPWQ